jgi:hypothetical protein
MTRRNGRPKGATLLEMRDLDLMHRLGDLGGEDEWVPTLILAEALGLPENVTGVGVRLGWMRRYGMLERRAEAKHRQALWRLSEGGQRVIQARSKAANIFDIERLPEEEMVEAMAAVTARYRHADPMLATMLRREFVFGTKR